MLGECKGRWRSLGLPSPCNTHTEADRTSQQDPSTPAVDGRMLRQSFCKVSAFQLLSGARPEGLQIHWEPIWY